MATPISSGHGIDGARLALIADDPEGAAAYRKLMAPEVAGDPERPGTMHKLVRGHNDIWTPGGLADRLAAVEEALQLRPF